MTDPRASDLAAIREQLGLTQEQLGALLDVSRVTVSRWEGGQQPIPGAALRLARILAEHPEIYAVEARRTGIVSGGYFFP